MFKDKAKEAERKAINALNQEETWISKHPGWVTLIGGALFIVLICAAVKGCH